MKPPIFVRELSEKDRERLEAGLRSKDAFVMRRCQILLASARGESPPKIAQSLGCASQTVRNAIRGFKGDAPPLSEGVRAQLESVDFGDGRRCRLRGGAHQRARLRRDDSGDAFAPPFGSLDAGQAVDHLPRPPIRKKKGDATG